MSKVKYKEPILEMSGSDGDIVHSRNRYGPYTRRKTKNKYKPTKARVKATNSLADVARAYNTLTDSQILLWAKKLETFNLRSTKKGRRIKTGRGFFIHVNKALVEIGEKIRMDVPHPEPAQKIDMLAEYCKESRKEDIILHISEPIRPDHKVILSATKPLGRGKPKVDRSWYKEIGLLDSKFKTGDSITEMYKKKYKTLGKDTYKICFRLREVNIDTGISNRAREFTMYFDPKAEI